MTEIRKRRYDLGGGVIISDNHTICMPTSSIRTSIPRALASGVRRSDRYLISLPPSFPIAKSTFYLHDFASIHGYWLGTKKWASLEEMQAQQQAGIEGKAHAVFTVKGETYYRELLPFAYWKVRHKPAQTIDRSDEMAQDYLSLAQNEDREQEKRFNEVIAPSGRTLAWLIKKLGAWLSFDPEPEPTKLTD